MLARVLHRLGAALRGGNLPGTVALVALLAALEVLGRGTRDDGSDAAIVAGLLLLVGVLAALEWRAPARAWRAVKRRAKACKDWGARRYAVKVGVDLRGEPALPRRALPHHRDLVPLFALWTLAALAVTFAPTALRDAITQVAYLPWLVLVACLWTLVLLTAAGLAFAAAAWLHDRFVIRPSGAPRPRARFEVLALSGLLVLIAVPGMLLPSWWAVAAAIVGFLALLGTLALTRCFDLALAWRRPEGRVVHGTTWHGTMLRELAFVLLAWFALVVTADGRSLLGLQPDPATFVTGMLGAALAWVGGVVLTAVFLIASAWLLRHRRADPARTVPTRVHLEGEAGVCTRAARELEAAGLRAARDDPQRDDVRLLIVPEPMPLPAPGEPTWPMRVSPTALRAPELIERIVRRDEIQRRRRLLRGIESAFKAAARRTYREGTGFWVAPHWWFVPAMSRDTGEEEWDPDEAPLLSDAVAPSWHALIGRAGRAHAHEMLRTLQVDFILVEDGLGFRTLRRVLRALFEHYDVQRRRIETRHLSGLPGVRCLIHEFTCGDAWKLDDYPEPDYDDISRARILHVFRDRGGEEELDPLPPERIDLPDFLPVGLGV